MGAALVLVYLKSKLLIMTRMLLALALACAGAGAAFPWQRVPTMCQTHLGGIFSRTAMVGTGRLDDAAVRFLARNYDLIVANGLEPGNTTGGGECAEPKVKDLI